MYVYTYVSCLNSPCLLCVCVYTTRNDNDVCSSLCRGYTGTKLGHVGSTTRVHERAIGHVSKPRYVAATCRSGEVRIGDISSSNFDKPGYRIGINAVNFGEDIVGGSLVSVSHFFFSCPGFRDGVVNFKRIEIFVSKLKYQLCL